MASTAMRFLVRLAAKLRRVSSFSIGFMWFSPSLLLLRTAYQGKSHSRHICGTLLYLLGPISPPAKRPPAGALGQRGAQATTRPSWRRVTRSAIWASSSLWVIMMRVWWKVSAVSFSSPATFWVVLASKPRWARPPGGGRAWSSGPGRWRCTAGPRRRGCGAGHPAFL